MKRSLTPTEEEIKNNKRSRSAKLRVAEVIDFNNNDNNKNEKSNKKKLGNKELARLLKRQSEEDNE